MDFISSLPASKLNGSVYDALLVIVDRYSKMALYVPTTKDVSAVQVANILLNVVISRFGSPRGIVSDRDSKFISKF